VAVPAGNPLGVGVTAAVATSVVVLGSVGVAVLVGVGVTVGSFAKTVALVQPP
jgi:hypothetical protein